MTCACNIAGLLQTSYQGIFSAAINGSTTVEIAEDSGLVLLGQTVNTLNISAYAFLPGQNKFLGVTCPASAQASIPWVTKVDCETNRTYFIPKSGAKASITNGPIDNCYLQCRPGIISTDLDANASSGPATPYTLSSREDGYNLVYNGNPIAVESAKPIVYTIQLGSLGSVQAYLQSFSLQVSPPDVARVQYSFVFTGTI